MSIHYKPCIVWLYTYRALQKYTLGIKIIQYVSWKASKRGKKVPKLSKFWGRGRGFCFIKPVNKTESMIIVHKYMMLHLHSITAIYHNNFDDYISLKTNFIEY